MAWKDEATELDTPQQWQKQAVSLDAAEDTQLRSTTFGALASNPDTYARAREIEAQTGVPADAVERNFDASDRAARTRQYDDILRALPTLRKNFQDSAFAKVAHDDLEPAGAVERVFQTIKAAVPNFNAGFWGAAQAISEQLAPALSRMTFGPGAVNVLDPVTQFAAGGRKYNDGLAQELGPDLSNVGTVERGVLGGVSSVLQNAPILAGALLTRNPTLATTGMAGLVGGQEYGKARDAGLPPNSALVYGGAQMTAEYVTERLPVGRLLEDFEKHSGVLKTILGQLVTEVPGEQLATLWQDFNEWAALHPDQPLQSYVDARPSAAAETLVATIVATGLQGGVPAVASGVSQELQQDRARAELAAAHGKHLADLTTASAESKLRERAPDLFQKFVEQAAADGPLQDVYVDARQLGQVLEQAGVNPAEVSPSVAAQLREASAVGGDVRIPIGEYAARIAGEDYAPELLQHLRTTPEAMSLAEAEVFNQGAAEKMKADAERVLKEKESDEEYQAGVETVEAQLLEQLTKANRFTGDVNKAYAALARDFYVTTAEKLGVAPEDLYARYPLRVTADENAGAQMDQLAPEQFEVKSIGQGDFEIIGRDATGFRVAEMIVGDHADNDESTLQVRLTKVDSSRRGEGIGQQLIEQAYQFAQRQGKRLVSDAAVSTKQLRVYEALRRKGWTIEYTDPAEVTRVLGDPTQEGAGTSTRKNDEHARLPVVTRIEPPTALQQGPRASARLATANVPAPRSGMRRFRHFGNKLVDELSPEFMGTGMKGAEQARLPVQTISLYPDTGFQKENGVGSHEYVVDVPESQLYDASADPQDFLDQATEASAYTVDDAGNMVPVDTRTDFTRFEELVRDAGFAGYHTPGAEGNLRGQARIFESIPVRDVQQLARLRKGGTLFQLAPEQEPHGFATIKPHLTASERMQLRSNTVQKLVQVFKDLPSDADFASAALAGVAKRGWYAHSSRAIRQVFGDVDAPRFAALLAALSPQVGIEQNFLHAVQMWANWDEAGRPTDDKAINAVLEKSVYGGRTGQVLGSWRNNTVRALSAADGAPITLSGPKVDSFMKNLLGNVEEATNDTWMANFALVNKVLFKGGLTKSGPGKSPGYVAMNAKLRRVAKRLTKETGEQWTAPEVQETVWSWAKTAVELADAAGETRSVEDLVRAGAITDARVASAPDFATLFKNDATIRQILEGAGHGEAINAIEVEFGRKATPGNQREAGVTPGLLRSARRLDELRRLRADDERANRGATQRAETAGSDERADAALDGLPDSSPGPLPAIQALADAYVRDTLVNKSDVPPHEVYVKADPARGARIAQAYEEAQHQPDDFEVQVAYDALIDETLAQYQLVKKLGLTVEMIAPGQNPYPEGPRQVFEDVRRGHLWTYPTDQGFGTDTSGAGHPLLRATNEKIGDHVLLANDVFRIVHDIFGHAKEGNGFGPNGEENAWQSHVRMYSPLAARAMTSETRGQNSWVNFGLHGEANRANQQQTVYAEQKATLLPEWVTTDGLLDGSVQPAAQVLEQPTLRVYHGTTRDVKQLKPGKQLTFDREDLGVHFGSPESANKRLEDAAREGRKGRPRIMPMDLTLNNPLRLPDVGAWKSAGKVARAIKAADPALTPAMDAVAKSAAKWSEEGLMEEIRQALEAAGYDGVVYANRYENGGDSYIALRPTQFKGAFDQTELAQGEGAARGQIEIQFPNGATISLLKNADLSTFLHELGHFFLEVTSDIAAQPNAPQPIADDMQKLLEWWDFTVQDGPGKRRRGTIQEWRAMSIDEKRGHHELFAENFEAYLYEGKAPTSELASLFAKFRSWLINVYRSLTNLNAQLTPEVRGVFDRMLVSQAAIEATEGARQAQPMFTSAEEAGMTPDEWQTYIETNAAAREQAVDELERRSLRDMQWASNARGRELKKLQTDVLEKRRALRAEVEPDVRAEPVYQVMRFLTTGKVTTEAGEELTTEEAHRFDRETVEKMKLGDKQMEKLEPYLRKDGASPDAVAGMFGFTSGDHLIKEILDAAPIADVVEAVTDQRMLERYGDITNVKDMERAADEAVHNEARSKFVATELRALDRMMSARAEGSSVNVNTKTAKAFVETIIARRRIRDLKPAQFAAAETRAAKNSVAELKAGNLDNAAVEKRNQLINGYAVSAAYQTLDELEKGLRYLRKFDNEGTRKGLDPEYLGQIDQMLERFDLRKRTATAREMEKRESLLEWVDKQRALGFEPEIAPELLNEARRTPYRELRVEQFRGLVDAVRNIAHLGRLKHKLLTSQSERELEAAVDAAAQEIEDNATKTLPEKLERNSAFEQLKESAAGFLAMHRKFASILRQMAGGKDGGELWNLLVRPLNEAGNKEARMRADATAALVKLFKPILKLGPLNGDKQYIKAIGKSLTREGRISVALNQGTDTNKRRVLEGDKWGPSQVKVILDTLSKEEWDFVQGVWDYINSYWPEIAAKEKRVTGIVPEKSEATPVETKHGAYRGGYYPIKYDPSRSSKAEADTDAEAIRQTMQGLYTRATTRRGHTKSRVESVQRPMRKDLGVVFEHLEQVIHDLSFHEYLIDANRLLRANKIDTVIRTHHGAAYLTQLKRALEDIAKGDTPAQNAMERVVNYLRTGSTIAGLGWNLTTALLQPIGLTQSMVRIGPKWVGRGLAEWLGSAPHMSQTVERIYDKSDFMKLRGQTMQREISEMRGRIHGDKMTAVTASFFYLIQKMQLVADVPTWLGAYAKAIDAANDEKTAVALADQAVLDAQGGGQVKDLAAIQRGGPMLKLWTNFYSFFNTTYNLAAERTHATNFKKPGDIGKLAVDYLLLYVVPATLGSLLHAAMSGGGDDDDLGKKLVADNLSYLLGSLVLLREFGGLASGFDYKGPTGTRFIADLYGLAKQAKQGEMDEAAFKAFLNVAGVFFHVPTGQIGRTLTGVDALVEGDTSNPLAAVAGAPH